MAVLMRGRGHGGAWRDWQGDEERLRADDERTDERRPRPLVTRLTIELVTVYRHCNVSYRYTNKLNPRRALTKPSEPARNYGFDNEEYDLLLHVNDVLESENEYPARRYEVIDLVGSGTFGQVVKARNTLTGELVAIKVIKNRPAYYNQAFMEIRIVQMLNDQADDRGRDGAIVRLKDNFMFRNHLCLVFELLSSTLYDVIKLNQFAGLPIDQCRSFARQVLDGLLFLRQHRIIHCDLKPENILKTSANGDDIKLIDFGSACFQYQTVYSYIQSRFYRSPEVLMELPYGFPIDIWSLGCIIAELFLGMPLFPGTCEYNQLARIAAICGQPSPDMIRRGKSSHKFFDLSVNPVGMKTASAYAEENAVDLPAELTSKATLDEIFRERCELSKDCIRMSDEDTSCFIHFLSGLLTTNPDDRWTPCQAIRHPFITGQPFRADYHPPPPVVHSIPQPIIAGGGLHISQPPSYSYSGHRLGGDGVGSASGLSGHHQLFGQSYESNQYDQAHTPGHYSYGGHYRRGSWQGNHQVPFSAGGYHQNQHHQLPNHRLQQHYNQQAALRQLHQQQQQNQFVKLSAAPTSRFNRRRSSVSESTHHPPPPITIPSNSHQAARNERPRQQPPPQRQQFQAPLSAGSSPYFDQYHNPWR